MAVKHKSHCNHAPMNEVHEQLRLLLCALEKSQYRHSDTGLHMRVAFHSLSDVTVVNSKKIRILYRRKKLRH